MTQTPRGSAYKSSVGLLDVPRAAGLDHGVRQGRIASVENGTRRSVSIATPKAARGTECSDETG